jgi:2-dehydro-3-deoxyglucarate aldolase/4-hydroxy-2-oxoheptanedioate aldolase
MENPKLIETVEAIRDSCMRHGVAPGIHNRSVQMAKFWRDRGMHLIGCNSEVGFLWERAKEVTAALL